jgi:acetoin utilization deacetylase AcuC-like enzyme
MTEPALSSKSPTSTTTGFVYDARYLQHMIEPGHPESPERLEAILEKLETTGLLGKLTPLPLFDDPLPHISRVHSQEHIAEILAIAHTGEIAQLAVAGALAGVDAVCRGKVRNAFCALRPPGHHALNTGQEEGFCYFNNIAIAARFCQAVHGLSRVLIIDWDYHHGNGTEWAFYNDPSVLFFSTHDWHAYPGSGAPSKSGQGPGKGYNLNVPLPRGATDDEMLQAWDTILLPAAEKFKPKIVLISAGFDSREDDLLGCFLLTDSCFARMTRMAMDIADTHADGRLVSFLEGGYDVDGLAQAVEAHVRALLLLQ